MHAAYGRVQITHEISTHPNTGSAGPMLLLTVDDDDRRELVAFDTQGNPAGSASEATAALDRMEVTRLRDVLDEWLESA